MVPLWNHRWNRIGCVIWEKNLKLNKTPTHIFLLSYTMCDNYNKTRPWWKWFDIRHFFSHNFKRLLNVGFSCFFSENCLFLFRAEGEHAAAVSSFNTLTKLTYAADKI